MNTLRLFLLVALLPFSLRAQEFKMKFASAQGRKVIIDLRQGGVTVEGYGGDELLITSPGYHEPPASSPSLAMGLRPMYAGGNDNTHLGLYVTQETGNTIRISSAPRSSGHYLVRVPRSTDVAFARNTWDNSEDVRVSGLSGRLEVTSTSGDVRLTNMSGPVVANTVSGDVRVEFSEVPAQPCALTSVSGNVDVTLPGSARVSLTMRSISGEIYTDFDLNLGSNGLHHVGGQTIEGRANGGGTTFSLRTVSGDVYLRKAK